MSCEVTVKDIQSRLRNQIKDKFESTQFFKYTDRLVGFVPYDALNPSKNVLYGKVKNLESQLNKEYGSSIYGPVISFEQKTNGVEISIHPTRQLADAMTNQNIQDEIGQDYYMGDEALKEQEERELSFSAREFTTIKKPLTDNYIEYLNYKKRQLNQIKIQLKEANRDRRNPKRNTEVLVNRIKKLNNIEAKIKEHIEQLEQNEIELMFSALFEDIRDLNKDLDNIENLFSIKDVKENMSFLYSLIKGIDYETKQNTDRESLKNFNHPNFEKLSSEIDNLVIKYNDSLSDVMDNILDESISYQNMQKNNPISEEELKNMFNVKDDISWFEKTFLGISSSSKEDSILNQVLKGLWEQKNLLRISEKKKYEDALNKFSKKFKSFEFIFEKTKGGTKTGNIINLYSPAFRKIYNAYSRINTSDLNGKEKYLKKISWLKENTEVIDIRKLKVVKDLYGDIYNDYFKFSEEEMNNYENYLRNILGPLYEDEIASTLNNLQIFQEKKTDLLNEENQFKHKNIAKIDPWAFIDNYYSPRYKEQINFNAGSINTEEVYSDIQNIRFIPKKDIFQTIDDNGNEVYIDSGYYNKDFNEILSNTDKLEYWKIMKEIYSDHINPIYNESMGGEFSYAKFEKKFIEEILEAQGLNKGSKLFKKSLHSFKELFYEKARVSTDKDAQKIKANYGDSTKKQIRELEEVLIQKNITELQEIAKQEDIQNIEQFNKQELSREIALRKIIKPFSEDINASTAALLDLAALHKARQDTLPIAQLILDSHKIKSPHRKRAIEKTENWINRQIKNETEVYRGIDSFLGKDISKTTYLGIILDKLSKLPILNRFIDKKKAYLMTDSEKELLKYLSELQDKGHNKEITDSFNIGENKYQIQQTEDGPKYYMVDKESNMSSVSEEQYEKAFQQNIEKKIEDLGLDLNGAGIIQGILKSIIIKGLALNPLSGVFNRIEGKNSLFIMDSTGYYWKKGNVIPADNFLMGANLIKILPERLQPNQLEHVKQLKIFNSFLQNFQLIQDKKNILEREAEKSMFKNRYFGNFANMNLYQSSVENPEFHNQGVGILAAMMDMKIKDKNGNEVQLFDGKKFNIWELQEGVLKLKEQFRTEENIANWENFEIDEQNLDNNQFFVNYLKMKNIIGRIQGNYDNLDVIDATRIIWGRTFTVFTKWLYENLMRRFSAGKGRDLFFDGKRKEVGRYRYLWKNKPALFTYGVIASFIAFGATPITLFAGLGLSGLIAHQFLSKQFGNSKNIESQARSLSDSLEMLKSVVIETLNYPLYLTHSSKLTGTIKNKTFNNLTQEEAGALQASSREIAIMLTFLALQLLIKKFTWDEDDEKDSKRRQFHNFADNQLSRIISSISVYSNPADFYSERSRFAFFRQIEKTQKALSAIISQDKEFDKTKELILDATPLPRLFYKGSLPWYDEREYNNTEWQDRYIKNLNSGGEWEAKEKYLKLREDKRKDFRELYQSQGLEREQLKDAINDAMKLEFPEKKKGESYNSILQRIESGEKGKAPKKR